nr:hypothetical protein BaRGS_000961 [Batillaria attramentaria]
MEKVEKLEGSARKVFINTIRISSVISVCYSYSKFTKSVGDRKRDYDTFSCRICTNPNRHHASTRSSCNDAKRRFSCCYNSQTAFRLSYHSWTNYGHRYSNSGTTGDYRSTKTNQRDNDSFGYKPRA